MAQRHVVAAGDCISSIGLKYGFFPETIWQAPENEELRTLRPNPNVLVAGDVVMIPDKQERTEKRGTDARHKFRRKGVPEVLRFQFFVAGEPRADESYVFEIDGKVIAEDGRTDADGKIEHDISPGAREAIVRFADESEYVFKLGHLDPIDTLRGQQSRLLSLGYFGGALDGQASAALHDAVARFQIENALDPSGELNDETRSALERKYGG
jgi:hypothetical protein